MCVRWRKQWGHANVCRERALGVVSTKQPDLQFIDPLFLVEVCIVRSVGGQGRGGMDHCEDSRQAEQHTPAGSIHESLGVLCVYVCVWGSRCSADGDFRTPTAWSNFLLLDYPIVSIEGCREAVSEFLGRVRPCCRLDSGGSRLQPKLSLDLTTRCAHTTQATRPSADPGQSQQSRVDDSH